MKLSIITPAFLALFLSSQVHSALVENSLFSHVNVDPFGLNVNELLESRTSNIDSVDFDSTPGTIIAPPLLTSGGFSEAGEVAGFASFGVLKAQTMASSNSVHRTSLTNVSTAFQLNIEAALPLDGGPGLAIGTDVNLGLSFRLDGNLLSAAVSGNNSGWAEISANLRIVDPNILLDCGSPDGCFTPRLVNFRADALTQTSSDFVGDVFTFNNWNWNFESRNAANELVDFASDSENLEFSHAGSACAGGPLADCLFDINFNTGIVSTIISTTVGATLDITASLNAFSQANNNAYGSVDFLNTYGLVFTSLTDGVELDYGNITPAAFDLGESSAIPVPAAFWLFGTALVGLVGFSKRRKSA